MAEKPEGRLLDDWITAYMAYTHSSESPDEYHLWTAMSTIAGAIRRKAFFTMNYFLVYPNLYVVLVGPPGRCKKSTAMRIGRAMLDKVPGCHFTTDSITRERLIQDMSQSYHDGHSSMTAFSSELASLLTSSGMDMVVFLTDIYESPTEWAHKTKMGGTQKIKAPYLNFFAATTPDWIAKSLPLDTVGIGLTSRIIFVYQDTPRIRPAFIRLTPEQVQLGKLLEHDLRQISLINGEYILDKDAELFYDEWYQIHTANPNPTNDPRLDGYFERKPIHMLKLGMIIAASRRNETIITMKDIEQSMSILELTEGKMPRVFASVGKNPLAFDMHSIEMMIAAHPEGLEYQSLLERFRFSIRESELAEVLELLRKVRRIEVVPSNTGPMYKPLNKKR